MTNIPMPGLERLLSACEKYSVRVELREPWAGAPTAGSLLMGRPFDPMLAAFYSRLGGLHFDNEFFINPCVEQMNGILEENEQLQSWWPEPFRSLLVFGSPGGMSYRYATVPSLADAQGFQPVVEVDPYEDVYALPVASNVDRFFDAYARYMDEFWEELDFRPTFPRGVPEIIAEDRALMGMLVEGRFDSLMFRPEVQSHVSMREEIHEDLRRWVATLRAASR